MMPDIHASTLLFIALVGMATYGTRLSGYWLLRNVQITGRAKAALDAVPPAILTAVIAPAVFLQGWPEKIAAAVTIAAALLRLPLLAVILLGCAVTAALRLALGG
ncbi:MAG: AzlD domain-containing protein [Hyphomicrobiales bacterium]